MDHQHHHHHPPNPNPYDTHTQTHSSENWDTLLPEFEFSDFLLQLDGDGGSEEGRYSPEPENMASSDNVIHRSIESLGASSSNMHVINSYSPNHILKCKTGGRKTKADQAGSTRFAFKTKSELEVMDDGFKWRKYGKKMVKNSPNPRNYYKCASAGCNVKKRVERDGEDRSYVITTYDGVHNHESPCVIYYNQTPLMVPDGWTLQPPSASSAQSSPS